MRQPNLIIAGVRKAGTTSLFHYLRQHPQIGDCRMKEPSYFVPLRYDREPGPFSEYLDLFSHCRNEPYVMEASPAYFAGAGKIAHPLARILARPRVVVILRNPVDTFASNFNFMRSRIVLPRQMPMEQYLDRCEVLHRREEDHLYENRYYNSIYAGMYDRFLPDWVDACGQKLKILFFDDLTANPRAVVTELCAWLGIDTAPTDAFDYSVENKTEQYRVRWLQQIALAINRRYKPFFRQFHGVKKVTRSAYYLANRAPRSNQTVPANCRTRLEAMYANPMRRLAAQLLQQGYSNLPPWLEPVAGVSGQHGHSSARVTRAAI